MAIQQPGQVKQPVQQTVTPQVKPIQPAQNMPAVQQPIAQQKTSIFKKWGFWLIVSLIIIGIISALILIF
ncbi:hypothetical protein CMI44_00375 [Candidatus Pacearchaeota archaeon]|nr:hypothetical protein [Candidatus Pacearchaeota archaeon]